MPRWEVTGRRPTTYSAWHRKLPDWCRLADIDGLEVRHGHVVALIETIQIQPESFAEAGKWILSDPWGECWYPRYDRRYPLWETKGVVLNYLIGVTKTLKVLIIYHTPDMARVRVIDYRQKKIKDFTEKEFFEWMQML